MKFQDLLEKLKKIKMEEIISFCKKNLRYIAAGALFIILLFVLVNCTNTGKGSTAITSSKITGAEGVYKVDENKAINTLITNYFTAYANGDLDGVAKVASPLSDNEKSYITMFSQYVDSYQGIKCYVKQGLDKKSYLVSVYLEMKFAGVDTVAPGLDFFYIQTKDDGSLYINNVYSQYNLLNKEQPQDANIEKLIEKFEKEDDVIALQSDVQSKYEAAVAADANLATMVNTTIANAYTAWSAQISLAAQQASTAQQSTQAATSEAASQPAAPATSEAASQPAAPATSEAASQPAAPAATPDTSNLTATNDTVYALDTVKIRDTASDTGNKVGSATVGMKFTRNGTTADGWSQIQYNGGTAYIKSEYLTTDASQTGPNASNNTTPSASASEGSSVRLSSTTNIRSAMSDSADKVGVAYPGETIKVVSNYAEGWSKVTWNGKTGYVKTDLLK